MTTAGVTDEVAVLLEVPLSGAEAAAVLAPAPAPHYRVLLPVEDVRRRLESGTTTLAGETSWASPLFLGEGGPERLLAESERVSLAALQTSVDVLRAHGAVSGGLFAEDPVAVLVVERRAGLSRGRSADPAAPASPAAAGGLSGEGAAAGRRTGDPAARGPPLIPP